MKNLGIKILDIVFVAVLLCSLSVFAYEIIPNPSANIEYTYSSLFEEMLQRTYKSTWKVNNSQILNNWSENGNRLQSQSLSIVGKTNNGY